MTSAARRPFAESLYRIATAVRANLLFDAIKPARDRKSTRLNSSHLVISYAVFCLKKKKEHVDFSGNRVAVIATGATGVQTIHHIASQYCHLNLFNGRLNCSRPIDNVQCDAAHKAQ